MADAGSMVVRLPKEEVERDVPPVHKKPGLQGTLAGWDGDKIGLTR